MINVNSNPVDILYAFEQSFHGRPPFSPTWNLDIGKAEGGYRVAIRGFFGCGMSVTAATLHEAAEELRQTVEAECKAFAAENRKRRKIVVGEE